MSARNNRSPDQNAQIKSKIDWTAFPRVNYIVLIFYSCLSQLNHILSSIWSMFNINIIFSTLFASLLPFFFRFSLHFFSSINIFLSFISMYREALPRLDNYRLSLRAFRRPSISLLHGEVLEHIPVSCISYNVFKENFDFFFHLSVTIFFSIWMKHTHTPYQLPYTVPIKKVYFSPTCLLAFNVFLIFRFCLFAQRSPPFVYTIWYSAIQLNESI